MRKKLIDYLSACGCRCIHRRGRSPVWEDASGTRRASFPRRPDLRPADVIRVCARLGLNHPTWLEEV